MKISARIDSQYNSQEIVVESNGIEKKLTLPIKESGFGCGVNGGELLLLALAVCYTNDIYREAAKSKIEVLGIEVVTEGKFPAEGQSGERFQYRVRIDSSAPPVTIEQLIRITDQVAEIHNTLRKGIEVSLMV